MFARSVRIILSTGKITATLIGKSHLSAEMAPITISTRAIVRLVAPMELV
jgi:hypothetical protein